MLDKSIYGLYWPYPFPEGPEFELVISNMFVLISPCSADTHISILYVESAITGTALVVNLLWELVVFIKEQ